MKIFAYSLFVLILGATVLAGPLQKEEVAADAKWLLHLDVDKLRSTSAGDYLIREIADKVFAEPKAVMKQDTGFDLDLTKIRSITAYGDYSAGNSVLLLKTDLDVEKALNGALARIVKEAKVESPPVGKTVQDGTVTYTLRDRAVLSLRPDKITIFSQSAAANRKADDVLSGRSANLGSSPAFAEFPDAPKTFFFLGAAEAFNAGLDSTSEAFSGGQNNPKARILKMTDSGRIVMGQEGEQLFLHVSLKAKTPEVVTQMQQVIQGMIALASLSQSGNEDIQALTDAAKVSTAGNIVNLSLSFPAEKALLILKKQVEQRARDHELIRGTNAPSKTKEK